MESFVTWHLVSKRPLPLLRGLLESLRSYANSKDNAMCSGTVVIPLVDIGMMQVGILPTEDEKLKIFEYLGEMEERCK